MQLLTLIYSGVTEVEKRLHAFNISNNHHHHNKSSVLPQKNSHAEILFFIQMSAVGWGSLQSSSLLPHLKSFILVRFGIFVLP